MATNFRLKKRMPTNSLRAHYQLLLNNRFEVQMDQLGKTYGVRFVMKDTPAGVGRRKSTTDVQDNVEIKSVMAKKRITKLANDERDMQKEVKSRNAVKKNKRAVGGQEVEMLSEEFENILRLPCSEEDTFVRVKPIRIASENQRLVHKIHLAVHTGGGHTDADRNPALRRTLKYCWENGMPQQDAERVVRQCTVGNNKLNSYKLQIHYKGNIYLICCLQVGQLLSVRNRVGRILQEYKARFDYAMKLFRNVGLIEAQLPPAMPFDFQDFETFIKRDARECKARVAEIIDYETGSVCFCCNPLHLQDVVRALRMKGYHVVYTEIGYRAHLLVDMSWPERSIYMEFLEQLFSVPQITHIYDNVRPAELPYDAVLTKESESD